jgi:hypothetical protein
MQDTNTNTKETFTNIRATSGLRTHDPCVREGVRCGEQLIKLWNGSPALLYVPIVMCRSPLVITQFTVSYSNIVITYEAGRAKYFGTEIS